jgi:predicted DNA-binding protein (MmcQ/YjbR family)
MDIESLREYCLGKKGVKEEFPFGDSTLVFKVGGKIFLLAGLDYSPLQFNVKLDPEHAVELREQYESIQPGYHMNKKHWSSVIIDGSVSEKLLRQLVDESYLLVVNSLSIKLRETL